MTSSQRMIMSCARINQKHFLSCNWHNMLTCWMILSDNWYSDEIVHVRFWMSTRMNSTVSGVNTRYNGESLRRFVLMSTWLDRRQTCCFLRPIQERTKRNQRTSCRKCERNARMNQTMIWILDRTFHVRPRNSILNRKSTNDKSWYNVDFCILRNTNEHQKLMSTVHWWCDFKIHSIER